MVNPERERPSEGVLVGEGSAAGAARLFTSRSGIKPWSLAVLSVLSAAGAVVAVGCLCALTYPILKDLRAERVRGEDGAEEKLLSFRSTAVLSALVGFICCICSWTLTYFDSYQPRVVFSKRATTNFRDGSGGGFHIGHGAAVLNGVMAMITVIWSLS